jgi:4-hydroxyproline epimerase
MERILVVDSHTEGEPTRVVLEGGPDLGPGTLAERRARFRDHYDHYRTAIGTEPRGSDVTVGALLCAPLDPSCAAGVIFFNNVGYLGMCGHGTMGVVATLAHLGRLRPGLHRIETPVGVVEAELHDDLHRVTVANVPSYRVSGEVVVDVPGHGGVQGSVAWGGNWFFLTGSHGQALHPDNVDALSDYAWRLQQALTAAGISGTEGAPIDHVELFGPSPVSGLHSRNFVLCPGRAYDRSPCGTGTSAKLACLHAEGVLAPGEVWRQESVIGGVFEASYTLDPRLPGHVLPRITGTAWITAEITLVLQDADPFRFGMGRSAR